MTTSTLCVFEIQWLPLLWIIPWDLDKWTRVFIRFAIRVSGLTCLCLSMVRMIDAGTSTCVRLFTALFVSFLQHNPVFIWYHTNKYWQYLAMLSLTMNSNSTINSLSSPQYMNRWLSISRSSFMILIHCYDSHKYSLLSWHSFSHYHFNPSIRLMYEYWHVSVFMFTICTCTCVWTHSSVVSSTVYMSTLCSSTLHLQHLTVSFTYTYTVTHPFHNVFKMIVYALFFVHFQTLMWFSLCCHAVLDVMVQMRWWVRMQFRSSSKLMSR